MKIIVTEKAMAGARIASILAGRNVPETRTDFAPQWEFTKGKTDYVVIPLRGHIIDVDFPKQYSYWIGTDLRKLNSAEINYVPTEPRIVSLLKKRAKDAEEVIIATDADREGEAIGVEALDCIKMSNPKIVPIIPAKAQEITIMANPTRALVNICLAFDSLASSSRAVIQVKPAKTR